ncbi:hypothetical protein BASA83_008046 [Batrachochytrium salamandrivorans]|nr:hypothetical protein BASA83_008046 [Batrachochytrium salamandrivorans]
MATRDKTTGGSKVSVLGPCKKKPAASAEIESANPLFVKWLSEWFEKAKADAFGNGTGAKLHWTYKKALDSMRLHPEKLVSGTDARRVKSVGPRIAERLEAQLQLHFKENPDARIAWDEALCASHGSDLSHQIDRAAILSDTPMQSCVPSQDKDTESMHNPLLSTALLSTRTAAASSRPRAKRKPPLEGVDQPRMYVPRYRSGAYAILVALFKHAPMDSFMSKQEIITAGQPYTDTSFVVSNAASGPPHTAWSSMMTLVKKELVIRSGVPYRFSLSEEGIAIAKLLTQLESSSVTSSLPASLSQSSTVYLELSSSEASHSDAGFSESDEPMIYKDVDFHDDMDFMQGLPPLKTDHLQNRVSLAGEKLHNRGGMGFSYIDCDGNSVQSRDDAEAVVCENTFILRYRVQFDLHGVTREFLKHVQIEGCVLDTGGEVRGLLQDSFAPKMASRQLAAASEPLSNQEAFIAKCRTGNAGAVSKPSAGNPCALQSLKQTRASSSSSSITNHGILYQPSTFRAEKSSHHGAAKSIVPSKIQLIHFPAGGFEIHLVLDSREVVRRNNRTFFQTELEKLGVPVLTRALALGDFIWVARKRKPNTDGYSLAVNEFEDGEIVLNSIIERKLLDDLVASIKDDRYKEQKFRLGSCGINNVIYLVEEGSSADAEGFGMSRIMTAMTQTQVLNHFFLKRTHSALDTVAYLHCMTQIITAAFKNENLYALRAVDVSKDTVTEMRRAVAHDLGTHIENVLLSYEAFCGMNTKTGSFTCGDIWMRQLMCIRGISAEKASAISARFPTPQSLKKSLASIPDSKAKQAMLRTIGDGRRAIGAALAVTIIEFFEADQYHE